MNKNTAWVCINKNFEYTEIEPNGNNTKIITADEYYDMYDNNIFSSDSISYYMTLRELLVYIGTYVLQYNVNPNTFVNIVNNIVNDTIRNNANISYVICTDVRFKHEFDFIKKKHGIVINVNRNDVNQLDNVAEHDLDYLDEKYDFNINNSGTYDDLFQNVWDMIHNNVIFSNKTYDLDVHENVSNYIRLISSGEYGAMKRWELCLEHGIQNIQYDEGKIYMISPIGGPIIKLYSVLDCSDGMRTIEINNIEYDINTNKYILS